MRRASGTDEASLLRGTREAGSAWRWSFALVLLALPLALVGPSLLPGKRFLPLHPVRFEPLAAERPEQAAALERGANYLTADRIFPVLTDQLALRERTLRGELATWEPRLGLGLPLFAGTLAGALYPPNALHLLLPPEVAGGWLALAALCLAGAGMALFLARLGLSPGACAIGAIALQAGGFGLANLHLGMKVDAALWLPWQLWAAEGLARGVRRSGPWLVATTALPLLAGFPPIAIFSVVGTLAWLAVRWLPKRDAAFPAGAEREPRRAPLLAALAFLTLGVGAASIQLLPTQEAARESLRAPRTAPDLAAESLPLATAATVVVPQLFGAPTEPVFAPHHAAAWWLTPAHRADAARNANPLEWSLFAGVAVVVLALVALVADTRRTAFPALALIAVVGFAQGWPGAQLLYTVPGLNLGAPSRVLSVAWILWPWLAALGAQALLDRRPRAMGAALVGAASLAGAGFALSAAIEPESFAAGLEPLLAGRHGVDLETVRGFVRPEDALETGRRLVRCGVQLVASGAAATAAILAVLLLRRTPGAFPQGPSVGSLLGTVLVICVVAFAPLGMAELSGGAPLERATLPGPGAATLACAAVAFLFAATWDHARRVELAGWLPLAVAIAIEGVAFGRPHLVPRDGDLEPFPPSAALAAIVEAAGDGRVLRLDTSPVGVEDVQRLARPNLPSAYGASDLTPYVAFTPRRTVELLEALDPRTRYRSGVARLPDPALLDHPILDLARVTAVLSRTPIDHPRLEAHYLGDELLVYRRSGSFPVARVVPSAVVATSDETGLGLLAGRLQDPGETTLLAPETPEALRRGSRGHAGEWKPGKVRVDRPAANRLDVSVRGSSGGWLVLHEAFFPGWKATIDGQNAVLARADHALRALPIPPGDSLVRTWYEPWSIRIGAALTLLSLAVAGLLERRLARRLPGVPAPAPAGETSLPRASARNGRQRSGAANDVEGRLRGEPPRP